MEVEIFLASFVLLWQRNWLKTGLYDILSCDDRETISSFSSQTLSFLLSRLYSAVRMCSILLYTMLYYTIHCQPVFYQRMLQSASSQYCLPFRTEIKLF